MPRPVKSGLGSHEKGVWGVDDGVENASIPLWKRVRLAWSDCATFSDFRGVDSENASENRRCKNDRVSHDMHFDRRHGIELVSRVQQRIHGELFK